VGGVCEAVNCIFVDREKSQPPAGAQEGGFQSTADRIAQRAQHKWKNPDSKESGPLVIFSEVRATNMHASHQKTSSKNAKHCCRPPSCFSIQHSCWSEPPRPFRADSANLWRHTCSDTCCECLHAHIGMFTRRTQLCTDPDAIRVTLLISLGSLYRFFGSK
jgi:hypothetical protein